jgi:hypothetical protein
MLCWMLCLLELWLLVMFTSLLLRYPANELISTVILREYMSLYILTIIYWIYVLCY